MNVECVGCGERFVSVGARGRTASYCSNACRQCAYRRRASAEKRFVESVEDRWVRAAGKRPVMVDGSPASSTNPATWASHAECVQGAGDGLGIILGGGLGCYDLDGVVVDGVLVSWAREFIESIREPVLYMEVSSSGRGVHVFVEAAESKGSRRCGVERYTRERFIRMTFNQFSL